METRNLTSAEVARFGIDSMAVNWGVIKDGQVVACFQAQPDFAGWLNVHANVKRHTLTPTETYAHARAFSTSLLAYGASGLICGMHPKHKAALRIAKKAGFQISQRCNNFVVLKKENDGRKN